LRDGDFIRLKNIELGYTLPKELIGDNDLKTRFYLSGLNLFNYSSFDLWDIEMAAVKLSCFSPKFDPSLDEHSLDKKYNSLLELERGVYIATDEGCVEDVYTSFVGNIAKTIVANPLYGVEYKQCREKSQVIDG